MCRHRPRPTEPPTRGRRLGRNGSLRAMNPAGYLDVFGDRSMALLTSAQANLEVAVPTCPGWTVAELITHVGTTWGWAAAIVRTGARDDLPSSPDEPGGAELLGWAAEQSLQLSDALKGADPDSNCWTFGLPRSRLFWFRRQALETAVHAWDVQHATGQPDPIDPDLASEVLMNSWRSCCRATSSVNPTTGRASRCTSTEPMARGMDGPAGPGCFSLHRPHARPGRRGPPRSRVVALLVVPQPTTVDRP